MSSMSDRSATRRFADTPVQKAALTVGIVFLLVGILAYANFFALRKAAEARGRG